MQIFAGARVRSLRDVGRATVREVLKLCSTGSSVHRSILRIKCPAPKPLSFGTDMYGKIDRTSALGTGRELLVLV